jgi:hypothetical protein
LSAKGFLDMILLELRTRIASEGFRTKSALALQRNIEIAHRHDVGFYSDDAGLLHDLTQFIGAALNAGKAVIVVATEPHRDSLLLKLQADGLDIGAASEQGMYIALDAAETVSTIMVDDLPDSDRFLKVTGDLIVESSQGCEGQACSRCSMR